MLITAIVIIALGGAVAIAFDRFAERHLALESIHDRLRQTSEELRLANKELVIARDQAEQGARSKSRFLASMSHEIRTPMNGVLGMVEILSTTSLTTDQRECVSVIQSSGTALLTIIEDILDISKLEQAQPSFARDRFDLRELLDDIAVLTSSLAEAKALKLHLRYMAEAPRYLVGDRGRVRQILLNLIGNAIKFTQRGYVLIDVSPSGAEGLLEVRIVDTGIGIEAASLASIFDPFHQAEISHMKIGGTGLGLTISRTLAQQMGGDLRVESRLGEGSTFLLTLTVELWTPEEATQPPATGIRVGVLASDPLESEIVCDMVGQCGARAEMVADGDDIRAAISDGRISRVILCHDSDQLAPDFSFPTLVIAPSSFLSETAEPIEATRVLRPVRLERLAHWLAAPTAESPETHSAYAPASAPSPADEGADRCVLVVDDNKVNRLIVRRMLEKEGLDVVEAHNGRQACTLSAAQRFSCILMDVSMPVMDGLDATAEIRQRERLEDDPPVPVIGLTAHASEEDHAACFAAGMNAVTTKPVSKAKLLSLLPVDDPGAQSAA